MSMVVFVMLRTIWIWDSTFRLSASMSLLRSSSASCVIKRLRMSWQKVTSYGPDNSSKGVCLMRRRVGCLFVNVDRVVVAISKIYTTLLGTLTALRFLRDFDALSIRSARDGIFPHLCNSLKQPHPSLLRDTRHETQTCCITTRTLTIKLNYYKLTTLYRTSLNNPLQQRWPQGSISKTKNWTHCK